MILGEKIRKFSVIVFVVKHKCQANETIESSFKIKLNVKT